MAFEMMEQIRKAEEKAEKIRLDAQREGREILKSAQEVSAANERSAEKDIRRDYQTAMEAGRARVENVIASAAVGRGKARGEMTLKALQNKARAVDYIVGRVLEK